MTETNNERRSFCFFKYFTPVNVLCAFLCIWECWAFVHSLHDNVVGNYWFNPQVTSDDALQQVFPFYDVYNPEIFSGDLIHEMMKGYLAPLHYWLGYVITYFTHDPIMTGHWIMLIQLIVILSFLFCSIKAVVGFAPAALGVAWFIHTRTVVQRLAGGLPRGWAAAVIAAFIFFAITKRHKCILVTILCGCLLHPPATLIIAVAYGGYLLLSCISKKGRKLALHYLLIYLMLSPFYAGITYSIVQRPEHIGQMVDYETALQMPEFSRASGRFKFVPLNPVVWEWQTYAFQPFFYHIYKPRINIGKYTVVFGNTWKVTMSYAIPLILLLGCILYWLRKRKTLPLPLGVLLVAIAMVYFASRLFAFKLYVPDRHLQYPMTVFFIVSICILVWGLFNKSEDIKSSKLRDAWPSLLASLGVACFVYIGEGSGMQGDANFNYSMYKKGKIFAWIRKNTPETALFAGHPTHIDAMQLFGMRKAFVTMETTHPFYPKYYAEMKRRIIVSLRAHYAHDWQEFVDILEPDKIDYFVFSRQRFYPEALKNEQMYEPIDSEILKDLTSAPAESYVYKKLPPKIDLEKAPFMLFKDEQSALIDVKALREWLKKQKQ